MREREKLGSATFRNNPERENSLVSPATEFSAEMSPVSSSSQQPNEAGWEYYPLSFVIIIPTTNLRQWRRRGVYYSTRLFNLSPFYVISPYSLAQTLRYGVFSSLDENRSSNPHGGSKQVSPIPTTQLPTGGGDVQRQKDSSKKKGPCFAC